MRERDRERGAVQMKVMTPGKIVPYKCSLPSSNISVMKNFDTDAPLLMLSHIIIKHDIS